MATGKEAELFYLATVVSVTPATIAVRFGGEFKVWCIGYSLVIYALLCTLGLFPTVH